jgi:hypothetical protein
MTFFFNTSLIVNNTFSPPALKDSVVRDSDDTNDGIEGGESVTRNLALCVTTS